MLVTHLFQPGTTTYETAKNSGHMLLLPSYDLRSALSKYYESFEEVRLKEQLYNDFVQTYVVPFVFEHLNLTTGALQPSIQAVNSAKISNLIIGYSILLRQLVETYETIALENKEVQNVIRKELTANERIRPVEFSHRYWVKKSGSG